MTRLHTSLPTQYLVIWNVNTMIITLCHLPSILNDSSLLKQYICHTCSPFIFFNYLFVTSYLTHPNPSPLNDLIGVRDFYPHPNPDSLLEIHYRLQNCYRASILPSDPPEKGGVDSAETILPLSAVECASVAWPRNSTGHGAAATRLEIAQRMNGQT